MKTEQQITAIEKEAKVLELAKAGYGFRQIAEQLGYAGPSSAHHAFKRALQKTIQLAADEYRALHIERLTQIYRVNYPAMLKGDHGAANLCLKALGDLANVVGINAPKEVKVNQEVIVMAGRIADDLGLNPADVIAEAERIVAAHQGSTA